MSLFVSGTDTDIGKTMVATLLAMKLGWDYWKPVQCGSEPQTDSEWVREYLAADRVLPESYSLHAPFSPHLAARMEGVEIQLENILRQRPTRPTVIEGAGGLLVPLNSTLLVIDLIRHLEIPLVLVAKSGLGTINHTLLSLEAARTRNLNVLGVILNGPPNDENKLAIEGYGHTRVLGHIPFFPYVTRETLQSATQLISLENPT